MVLEETVHPYITRVFELIEDSRNFYIVMEHVNGGNLYEKIRTMHRFSEDQAAEMIKQLLLALNYMHELCIMHRDLKPENILYEESDDGQITIKLTDFGFATRFGSGKKETI